jgi:hypothetical protein
MTCARTGASLRKQILENIRLTLAEKIGGDNYNNEINEKNVSNRTRKWDECPTYPYICVNGAEERKEDERESQMYAYMTVRLYLYVKDGTDASSKLEDLIQDVEKAMYIDETRGNLAVNSVAKSIETDNGWLGQYGMAEFLFEIQYRYLYGNP